MRRRLPLLAVLLALAAPAGASAGSGTIVGGAETTKQWPFMVYLEQGRQELDLLDAQFCGGSLIAPTWVLTAGHCIENEALDPLLTTVVIGRHAISGDDGERIQAKRIVQHPTYVDSGEDLALIELQRAPAAGPTPIKIAGPGEESLWGPGAMATILGWGNTNPEGSPSDVLKEAQVPVVSDAECAAAYSQVPDFDFKPAIEVCAGYLGTGGTDTCQGDSGGPMITTAPDGTLRQVGVTSRGEGCADPKFPGVYARVGGPALRAFIAEYVPGAIAPAPAAAPAPAPSGPAPAATGGSGTQSTAPASSPRSTPTASPSKAKKKKDPCRKYRKAKTRKGKAKLRACIKRNRKKR